MDDKKGRAMKEREEEGPLAIKGRPTTTKIIRYGSPRRSSTEVLNRTYSHQYFKIPVEHPAIY